MEEAADKAEEEFAALVEAAAKALEEYAAMRKQNVKEEKQENR